MISNQFGSMTQDLYCDPLPMEDQIESFLKHLIELQLVDNGLENETLSRFLEMFERFED